MTLAGKPNPSSAASTIPAVIASTDSWDILFGTQMLLPKTGTLVEIISVKPPTHHRYHHVQKKSMSVTFVSFGVFFFIDELSRLTLVRSTRFRTPLQTIRRLPKRSPPKPRMNPQQRRQQPRLPLRILRIAPHLLPMHRHPQHPLPHPIPDQTQPPLQLSHATHPVLRVADDLAEEERERGEGEFGLARFVAWSVDDVRCRGGGGG